MPKVLMGKPTDRLAVKHVASKTPDILDLSRRRVFRKSSMLDVQRRYLTDSFTPQALGTLLKNVDQGDIAAMVELDQEILAKDAHAQSEAQKRRQAVTALEWSIEPDTKAEDKDLAAKAANFCEDELTNILTWKSTLKHMATAIGPGIAVTELVWQRSRLVETVDVPGHRLMGSLVDPQELVIQTDEDIVNGVPITPGKFIVFTPEPQAGFPLRVTITRAQASLFVRSICAMADWSAFLEIFGMPMRTATMENTEDAGEVAKVVEMLENMGTDTYGVFGSGTEIQFIEAGRGTQPYGDYIDRLDAKTSILWRGQTLTTETGGVGSLALGRVHENVSASILLSDLDNEATMIRNQVLSPMTRLAFPNMGAPVPVFKRRVLEERNLDADRVTMDQLRLAKEMGVSVDMDVLHEKLNIPIPKDPDNAEAVPTP